MDLLVTIYGYSKNNNRNDLRFGLPLYPAIKNEFIQFFCCHSDIFNILY